MSRGRDTDGYEITLNGKSRGIYLKETADAKLKKLMGRRKWYSALFPGTVVYSTASGDRLELTNVGCYRCARAQRRKEKAK